MNTEKLDFNRFENLVAEREKLAALSHKLSELQEQKQKLEAEATQVRQFNLKDQAEMVLDGTYETRDFNREIEQLDNTIEVHQQAVNLQNQRLNGLERSCSKQICDEIQPDYRQVVRKMRDAAQAMIAAMELEAKFIDELQRRDVDIGYIGRIFFPRVLNKDSLQAFVQSTEERKEG
jgi:hypothetical protein